MSLYLGETKITPVELVEKRGVDYAKIFNSIEEMNNDPDKHEGALAIVYDDRIVPVGEDTIFKKFVKPSGNVVLEQNIMQYIDEFKNIDLNELEDGEELNKTFYQTVFYEDNTAHHFNIYNITVNIKQDYDEQTEQYGDWKYVFDVYAEITIADEEVSSAEASIQFSSYDGINFTPYFALASSIDPITGEMVWVPQNCIESLVFIDFSKAEYTAEIAEWNDVLSEFLFTGQTFEGLYEVQNNEYVRK